MIAAMCPSTNHGPRRLTEPMISGGAWPCPACGIAWTPEQARWRLTESQRRALSKAFTNGRNGVYGGASGTSALESLSFDVTATLEGLRRAGLVRQVQAFSWGRYIATDLGRKVAATLQEAR